MLIKAVSYNGIGLPIFNELFKYSENSFFSLMGVWSLGLAIISIALAIGLSYLVDQKHKWFDELSNKYLTPAFVAVWLFGFVVYDIGMYTGEPWSLLGNVPMAILHAFEIFVLESDVSAVHEPFHNNAWYMFGFSLAHFLAALVSLVFVLRHFGYSVIAAFKRRFVLSSKETTYMFWGMNDATYYLARDINQKASEMNNHRIVIVRTNHDTNTGVVRNGMERLFNFLSLKNNDLDRFKELNCISMSTYSNLATIDTKSVEKNSSIDILQKILRLKSLCRIISKKTTKSLHLFFLSDDEEINIQGVANLRYDKQIQAFAKRGKVTLYCHARYNSIHRVIEDELADERIEVKVVDSSHISVELLKNTPELHPVRYVDIEKDATVSSPFNALVVGFGEVGMDAVRFLYEFGAFVKSDQGETIVKRSEFNCHVIDQKMDDLAGQFKVNAPSLANEQDGGPKINLCNMDCRSVEFYNKLKDWIPTLNYVVVATGDDETNISLAVRIFRLAIRYRENKLSRFRILVRVQHDENGHIQKIADHYNRLWAANEKSTCKDNLHQLVVLASDLINSPLTLFGSSNQVYTYTNVVKETLKEDAKKFKMKYDLSVNELRRLAGEEPYPIKSWDEEQNDLMQLTEAYKGYAPTFSGVMKLRRIQNQNIANSLHKETKKWLAETALGHECYEEMLRHGLDRKENSLAYSWRDHANLPIENVQRVMDVLAQTEHLRWNASHEILGYQMGKDNDGFKDEAKLLHGCLKDWNRLKDMTKSYDYNIVDVSLDIIEIDSNRL